MNSPKKTAVELSPRRYELSPGGTIWKNPQLLGERSELSDFTFEPVSLSTTGESTFSWDVSTDNSDDMVPPSKQRYIASGASQHRHAASGSSFKTVSISKTTAETDNMSTEVTPSKEGSIEKPPSQSNTTPSKNTSCTVFAFLENVFCCGLDTTDDPKQERQQDLDDNFLGRIITCQVITCNCEGCTGCVGRCPDNEVDPDDDDVAQ